MKKTIQYILIASIVILIGGAIYIGVRDRQPADAGSPSQSDELSADKKAILTVNATDQIRGNQSAPITLVEYSDFQCPYCIRYHNTLLEMIQKDGNDFRWVFRHFPLPFHAYAEKASIAAEAAGKQGKFWEFCDKMAENSASDGTGIKEDDLNKYANELGLDLNKFKTDLSDPKIIEKVANDKKTAKDLGIEGTPASYLIGPNGKVETISGFLTTEQLKAKIDALKIK